MWTSYRGSTDDALQGLARRDGQLRQRESDYQALLVSRKDSSEKWTLDELWLDSNTYLLYIYEVTRQLSEAVRDDERHAALKSTDVEAVINACKQQLSAVRVPLAKFQAAGRKRDHYDVAYPWLHKSGCVAWEIASYRMFSVTRCLPYHSDQRVIQSAIQSAYGLCRSSSCTLTTSCCECAAS